MKRVIRKKVLQMSIKSTIESRYQALSPSHQKIARYISAHYDETLFSPLSVLSERIGTSPATIVRFCRAIGFEGYTDLQKSAQSMAVFARPTETAPLAADDLKGIAQAAQKNLAEMYCNIDEAQLDRVCREILCAKNVLVVGYMDSFGVAAELLHRLYCIRDGVLFSRLIYDWNDILNLANPETLILAVSFAPHYAYTHTCVQLAHARGSRIILLTDSMLNPLSGFANETLVFHLQRYGKEQGHEQLDVSPVFAYIQYLARHLVAHYSDQLLDANRNNEPYITE